MFFVYLRKIRGFYFTKSFNYKQSWIQWRRFNQYTFQYAFVSFIKSYEDIYMKSNWNLLLWLFTIEGYLIAGQNKFLSQIDYHNRKWNFFLNCVYLSFVVVKKTGRSFYGRKQKEKEIWFGGKNYFKRLLPSE